MLLHHHAGDVLVGEYDWFWKKLNSHLENSQLKQTQQRKLIVECFLRLGKHVDAERLYVALKNEGHHIGLATIYRTLNLLTEAGLLEQKNFADGRSHFEVQDPESHHDHLICLDCGKVIEFEDKEIESLQVKIASSNGFRLERHRLDLFGRCLDGATCARKNA